MVSALTASDIDADQVVPYCDGDHRAISTDDSDRGPAGEPVKKPPKKIPPLTGLTDVGLETGKSKQNVQQILKGNSGSPQPVARLAAGPVYIKSEMVGFVNDPKHKPIVRGWDWPPEWELIGRTEIAQHLGVKPTRADAIMGEAAAPAPVARPRAGRVWRKDEVFLFLASRDSGKSHPRYQVDMDLAVSLYEGDDTTEGVGINPLAYRLGIPPNVMRARLVAAGVTLRTADVHVTQVPITDAESDKIIKELAKPGATPYSVGLLLGRSPLTIQRIAIQREDDLNRARAEAPAEDNDDTDGTAATG